MRKILWLGWAALVAMLLALGAVFFYVPNEKIMGAVQKIFYFHVASAWIGFLAFFVVFVLSIMYLRTRDHKWDIFAAVSAEIGVLFTTIVLITGPIWGKATWGVWWTWEPRLTTTLVLWFIYLAYIMVRSAVLEKEKQARLAAVFGIIGFLDVPLVFMSIRWWRTIHPVVVDAGGWQITPSMLQTLLLSLLAFTLLYLYFLLKGGLLASRKEELREMKELHQQKTFDSLGA